MTIRRCHELNRQCIYTFETMVDFPSVLCYHRLVKRFSKQFQKLMRQRCLEQISFCTPSDKIVLHAELQPREILG